MADRPPIYKHSVSDEEEETDWKHFKTGKALKTKRGDRADFDGKTYEAIGHMHEDPEHFRALRDDEGNDAGSGTLRGKKFDRTHNDGVLWKEVKETPTS